VIAGSEEMQIQIRMKKLMLLLPLASLTACGEIDPQTAALMAQSFQTAATANMNYQPI
jgi:hypothetical protein